MASRRSESSDSVAAIEEPRYDDDSDEAPVASFGLKPVLSKSLSAHSGSSSKSEMTSTGDDNNDKNAPPKVLATARGLSPLRAQPTFSGEASEASTAVSPQGFDVISTQSTSKYHSHVNARLVEQNALLSSALAHVTAEKRKLAYALPLFLQYHFLILDLLQKQEFDSQIGARDCSRACEGPGG